jgi:hypothetical protein
MKSTTAWLYMLLRTLVGVKWLKLWQMMCTGYSYHRKFVLGAMGGRARLLNTLLDIDVGPRKALSRKRLP